MSGPAWGRTRRALLIVAAALSLGACSRATAGLAGDPAKTCAEVETLAQVKSIIFDNAATAAPSEVKLLVPELARQSSFRVSMAVLDGYDKDTRRTSCSGRAEIGFPATAASALGTASASSDIHYTAQPSADGKGTVYTVEGAGDLISGIAAANLQAWRASATAPASPEASPQEPEAAPASQPAAAPEPSAADLLRDDAHLQAREQTVRGLYQNALERDATGQVKAEQDAALADRARCHSKACVEAWFDRRERALRAWDGG